jgi:hypothetical protein
MRVAAVGILAWVVVVLLEMRDGSYCSRSEARGFGGRYVLGVWK